ncbi:MAG: M14 family metallopeptidase [Phyllobacterium sp.]
MTAIFEARFERTIDTLLSRYGTEGARGTTLAAWLFDDEKTRRDAEKNLAAFGVKAKFYSAYKPLVHFFLEEVEVAALKDIVVRYPVHPNCPKNRFLLETYPLAALVADATIRFEAVEEPSFFYDVELVYKNGKTEKHRIFAPNRVHQDFVGETLVSPTGWLIAGTGEGEINERLETDLEQLFTASINSIASHDWGQREPYFEELNIRANLPVIENRLPVGEEVISLIEALHEDFYFTLLEVFQKKSGRPLGDRGLQPGHIVPEIVFSDSAPSVRIETRTLSVTDSESPGQDLSTAQAPISAHQVRTELEKIDGREFKAYSRAGRSVWARYHKGSDAPIMISGGQHPNETTGIVGVLRAAQALAKRQRAHFTISPLENPDGYEIHKRLCVDNPAHMHHAARYTALGDDLEYRTGENLREKAIRVEAERLTGAKLHVNLHGYPSHEWTRPLSGYVPRNFAMWTLPKGFFLVMRHHAGWAEIAENLIDRVTRHLAAVPGLVEHSNAQIRLFETHAGQTGFRIINGFPCLVSVDERHTVPMTLITEYPDETIYGEAFIKGHTAQMETVLAAYDALQMIANENVLNEPALTS